MRPELDQLDGRPELTVRELQFDPIQVRIVGDQQVSLRDRSEQCVGQHGVARVAGAQCLLQGGPRTRQQGGVENLGFGDLRARLGPVRRGQGANAEQRDSHQQRQHGVSLHPRSCRSSCLGRRPHRIEYAEFAVVWEVTRFDCDRASARIALRRFVPLTRIETRIPVLGAADVGVRVAARARLW